jgi:hypothetical protein
VRGIQNPIILIRIFWLLGLYVRNLFWQVKIFKQNVKGGCDSDRGLTDEAK